jgi:WD40 repeat protein
MNLAEEARRTSTHCIHAALNCLTSRAGQVRIWDLRKKNCAYIIPAHSALVSHVKYQPVHGKYLLTTSYDKTCKAWNARRYGVVFS